MNSYLLAARREKKKPKAATEIEQEHSSSHPPELQANSMTTASQRVPLKLASSH